MWGALIAGAASYFGGRSERSANKGNTKQDYRNREAEARLNRQFALEDRRYNEKAIGNYRQFAKNPGLMQPIEYTDPASAGYKDPYGKKG